MRAPLAYYNENDRFAAAWLRNLIDAGRIAPGVVDERSIKDVRPEDLDGFSQAHFFAGIGGWSLALRLAGWPDNRPCWTGSCPCQPFAAAGKRQGFADDRHLWPFWFPLIKERQPDIVFGEQVATKDGLAWLDLVHADMESADYAIGTVDLCVAGVGAPHIRQRLWFVADRESERWTGRQDDQDEGRRERASGRDGAAGELADTVGGRNGDERQQPSREQRLFAQGGSRSDMADAASGGCGIVGDASLPRRGGHTDGGGATVGVVQDDAERAGLEGHAGYGHNSGEPRRLAAHQAGSIAAAGRTRGFWRDADWIACRDGKWRPVESGLEPLAHGVSGRVAVVVPDGSAEAAQPKTHWYNRTGALKGFGNAISPEAGAAVVRAFMEASSSLPHPLFTGAA